MWRSTKVVAAARFGWSVGPALFEVHDPHSLANGRPLLARRLAARAREVRGRRIQRK